MMSEGDLYAVVLCEGGHPVKCLAVAGRRASCLHASLFNAGSGGTDATAEVVAVSIRWPKRFASLSQGQPRHKLVSS